MNSQMMRKSQQAALNGTGKPSYQSSTMHDGSLQPVNITISANQHSEVRNFVDSLQSSKNTKFIKLKSSQQNAMERTRACEFEYSSQFPAGSLSKNQRKNPKGRARKEKVGA